MRACTTANAIFLGLVLLAATFSACASSGTQPQTTEGPGAAGTAGASTPSGAATEGASADTAGQTAAPPQKQPETVADCKQLQSDITNEPPAGALPMNNAAAPDAGASDRLQPIVDVIKTNRDKFRCCFDLWGRKNPGGAGRVMLKIKLKPDGSVESAETVQKDSTVTAPEVHSCIVEVAKSLSYPKSPSGKETTYNHPFDFKAHH